MRVMMINSVYKYGSTGRIVYNLCNLLNSKGEETSVLYGRGRREKDKNVIRVTSTLEVYTHAMMARISDRAGFYSSFATRRIIKEIERFKPDVIHLHNLHGYYLNIEMLFSFLSESGIPIVWTLHDCWAFTGHCTYYSYNNCNKWITKCQNCNQKKCYPSSMMLDCSTKNYLQKKDLYSKNNSLTVVTVSKWLESEVRRSILSEKNILTIYNGVNIDKFKPTTSDVRERLGIHDKYMFLCVSDDWDDRKGFSDILLLSKKIHDHSVIVVIGVSKRQIDILPDNVIGLEKTWDQKELIEYYSAADVLFNPSREETFGLVTVEALACGTPAIVYDTTACKELIDNECGVVLPYLQLDETPVDRLYLKKSSFTQKCRDKALKYFDESKCYNRYYRLYKDILDLIE